jgi:hypothetical protein
MDRRQFFTEALPGSLALASVLTLARASDAQEEQRGFVFLARSKAATLDGVDHRVLLSGCGTVSPSQIVGGGLFVHFDNAAAVPKTIIGTGTWTANRLLNFNLIGAWGTAAAGVFEAEVEILTVDGQVIPATLKFVCNIGAAGLSTGQDEGFTLTVPGAPFGPFVPLVPADGLTALTVTPVPIVTALQPDTWGRIKAEFR